MPKRGIPNRLMYSGPWEPDWFKTLNQKFLPNNTEFMYFDYDSLDKNVSMISKEMEKVGIQGAQKAYNLIRSYAFKKDLYSWMALWHYGGIYMDLKMGFQHNVSDWIDFKNDEYV